MGCQRCVIIQTNASPHLPLAQRRIGLTGGIATGKSTDFFSREALQPATPGAASVLKRYGEQVAAENGLIDRRALGRIVFNDQAERRWLEALLHPLVRDRFDVELERLRAAPVVVLVIPLLFEAGLEAICSETWLVDCDEQQQLQRLMTRDQLSPAEAQARVAAQWPLAQKRELADRVISNRSTNEALAQRLAAALQQIFSP